MDQAAPNALPGGQTARVLPDLPATPAEQNDTTPKDVFNHGARLADKLIDAVEFNLDAAIQKANDPDNVSQPVAANSASFLPSAFQTAYERNRIWFFGLLIVAVSVAVLRFIRR